MGGARAWWLMALPTMSSQPYTNAHHTLKTWETQLARVIASQLLVHLSSFLTALLLAVLRASVRLSEPRQTPSFHLFPCFTFPLPAIFLAHR